ncbi:hypothetical protein Tsubulata_014149 [Turnera subulata]|uniref:Uncharacterized protein n=1 Tax=Turnera subulata TaxID=218843 RepID=A0A9Q0F5F8_9ROSI|nr:hypothetical protein Tsubulata_014149 [Turnera subulata]
MIDFEPKRKDTGRRRKPSAGLERQPRLDILEKITETASLDEIEAYYYKVYLPRASPESKTKSFKKVSSSGPEKKPRASSQDRKSTEAAALHGSKSCYHRENVQRTIPRNSPDETVKKEKRPLISFLQQETQSPAIPETYYHRENVDRNLPQPKYGAVEKVSADPERRPRVRFVDRDTKTEPCYGRKIMSRSTDLPGSKSGTTVNKNISADVEMRPRGRFSGQEGTKFAVYETPASCLRDKIPKAILESKTDKTVKVKSGFEKQPLANLLEIETESVSLPEIKAYNCGGENVPRFLPGSQLGSANYKVSASLENGTRIRFLGTNEKEAFEDRVRCGTVGKVAFAHQNISRTLKKVEIFDERKKVTKTIKKKKVAFDESKNIIRWFEIEKHETESHFIDVDYHQEKDEYANLSNEELGSRCDEFIQRLSMQMRLQAYAAAV